MTPEQWKQRRNELAIQHFGSQTISIFELSAFNAGFDAGYAERDSEVNELKQRNEELEMHNSEHGCGVAKVSRAKDQLEAENKRLREALSWTACWDCQVEGKRNSQSSHPDLDACLQAQVLNPSTKTSEGE